MTYQFTFGTVCSGIGAPEAAWGGLGWRCAFMSEIEAFPRAVLKFHYPEHPLHGDFTTIEAGAYAPIDLLAGGTPCQSFSVAGLRRGLADDRGNLALEFVLLADRLRPRWLAWENVPGVFSSRPGDEPSEDGEDEDLTGHNGGPVLDDDDRAPAGSDFAAFLSALVRWEVPIPEGGWRNGGIITPAPVDGAYGVAWGVLDAQYFGIPQRRRRVFVVGYIGDWRPAAAVLFERYCLQGHPPPRREPGKRPAPTISARPSAGGGLGTDFDLDGGIVEHGRAEYVGNAEGGAPETPFLTRSNLGKHVNNQTPLVEAPYSIMPMNSGKDYVARAVEVAQPLMGAGPTSGNQGGDFIVREAVCFNAREDTDVSGDIAAPLGSSLPQANAIAFALRGRDDGAQPEVHDDGDSVGALRAADGGSSRDYVAFSNAGHFGAMAETDVGDPLRAKGGDTGNGGETVVAIPLLEIGKGTTSRGKGPNGSGIGEDGDPMFTLQAGAQHGVGHEQAQGTSAVRRLTPEECEALQDFERHYTRIAWGGKPAELCPDGPRYRALGNSMCRKVMVYLGERIQLVDQLIRGEQ